MRPPTFLIDVHSDGDAVVVAPRGDIDLATAAQVDAALARGEDRRVVVLDLRGVTFMDSAGLGLVVQHHLRAEREGFTFRLVPGPREVERLFELTGLKRRLVWADPSAEPPTASTTRRG